MVYTCKHYLQLIKSSSVCIFLPGLVWRRALDLCSHHHCGWRVPNYCQTVDLARWAASAISHCPPLWCRLCQPGRRQNHAAQPLLSQVLLPDKKVNTKIATFYKTLILALTLKTFCSALLYMLGLPYSIIKKKSLCVCKGRDFLAAVCAVPCYYLTHTIFYEHKDARRGDVILISGARVAAALRGARWICAHGRSLMLTIFHK